MGPFLSLNSYRSGVPMETWMTCDLRTAVGPGPFFFFCSASITGNRTAEKGREERTRLGVVSKDLHPDPSTQLSLPGASLVAQTVKNLPAMRKTQVQSLGQEDSWRRKWQPTPVCLPGESLGQRSLLLLLLSRFSRVRLCATP